MKTRRQSFVCGLVVNPSYFIKVGNELFCNRFRRKDFNLFAESHQPGKELITDVDGGSHDEMMIVYFFIANAFCSKLVDRSVQQRHNETNSYLLFYAAVHGNSALGVCPNINFFEFFFALSRFTS